MSRKKLLILDDDQTLGKTIAVVANATGWDATSVASAQDVLEVISDKEYDCFLTDYHMPGENGLEVIECVRNLHCSIPAVIMSGSPLHLNCFQKESLGIIDFMQKPFGYRELKLVLAKVSDMGLVMAA
ncbi:MAG: response regulator [Verrucomicrobiota bacterium]